MKKLKIYLDTSVINFLFADDSPEYKENTKEFFNNFVKTGFYDVYISDVVVKEIERTPYEEKKIELLSVIRNYGLKIFEGNQESEILAQKYIEQNVIPKRKIDDARHIAIATINNFDILLSWNFKHLSNINKQISIRIVNEQNGYYYPLILCTPLEVLYETN